MADRSLADLDIAVAHWHVNAWGGAEYLATRLAEAVGENKVYTMGTPTPDSPNPYGDIAFQDVLPSLSPKPLRRLQRHAGRVFEYALWEDVDWRSLGDPDVVITSGATTRATITSDDTLHLNYCHSPPRWFYDLYHDRKDSPLGQLARPLVRYLRTRDMAIDPRVDHYLVNSPIIKRRLWKYYKRNSEVLYPPVDLDACHEGEDQGYYLHLGRLDEEKGVPAVVAAFSGTDHHLVFAGGEGDIDDSVRNDIERAPNIEYKGFVPEETKYNLLANCRAVVFNGRNEDFGIVPIEANASGKAVLTRDEGFPGIFIENGSNGYTHDGTSAGITDAVKRFERDDIDRNLREHVESFSTVAFEKRVESKITRKHNTFIKMTDTNL